MGALASVLRLGRSIGVLLAGIFLFHAGWYLVLPFLAVLLTARRHLTPADAGLVMAAQSFALLAGSLAGGWLADTLGRRTTMVGGLFLRAAGIGAFGFAAGLPSFLAASAVAGLGGGLYAPAAKAAIAVLADSEEARETAFPLRGIAANVGTGLGPLIGSWLVGGSMAVLFGASAVIHLALALLTWGLLKADAGRPESGRASVRSLLADRPFLLYSLVTGLAWALFAQLALSVPLYAGKVLGLEASIGLLFTAASLTLILLQVPVSRLVLARLHPMAAMAGGAVLMGAGMGLVPLTRSFAGLLGAVLIFILGEMLLVPTADIAVSAMARQGAVGSYFGIATLSWGLGEGLGNLSGGALMGYALRTGRLGLPWLIYAAAGLAIGVSYWALRRRRPSDG